VTREEAAIELNLIGVEVARLAERERVAPDRAWARVLAWEHVGQRIRAVELTLRGRR
jgi:hypothetical protein